MNFALKVQKRVASGLVTPLAIFQGITGLLLLWEVGFARLKEPWLILGIALYVVALLIVLPGHLSGTAHPARGLGDAATARRAKWAAAAHHGRRSTHPNGEHDQRRADRRDRVPDGHRVARLLPGYTAVLEVPASAESLARAARRCAARRPPRPCR